MNKPYEVEVKVAEEVKKVKPDVFASPMQSVFAVALSVLVGLWVMFTLGGNPLVGINLFVFTMLAAVAVAIMMFLDDNLKIGHAVFWLAVIAAISSRFFRFDGPEALPFLLMPAVVVFFSIYAAKQQREQVIGQFFYRHFAFFIHFWQLFMVKFGGKNEKQTGNALKILLGAGISFVLLLIIVPLMLSSDVMFKTTMEKVFDLNEFFRTFGGRLFMGGMATVLGFAFLFTVTVKKNAPLQTSADKKQPADMGAMIITVLTTLGFVFALFTAIQVWFLFIKAGGGLPDGCTYTEYAVDGYWNQAFLTIINLLVVLGAQALSKNTTDGKAKPIKGLLTLLTGLNTYLVLSAAYKMHLYEGAYGFTEKRLLIYFILAFELVMLVLLVYSIFKKDFPYIKTVVYLAAAYFAVVACLNLDVISLKQNIERYKQTGEIDIDYMVYDAVNAPYVVRDFYLENQDKLSAMDKIKIEEHFKLYNHPPYNEYEVAEYERAKRDEKWYEFNLTRYRKIQASRDIKAFLE